MATVAHHPVVTGRVQGVFFRDSTRRQARAAGVVGWVHNRHDGAVEMHLEGEEAAVARVEAWVREGGPPRAEVDGVEVAEVDPIGAAAFRVV
jgi:acylphosphatase